MALTDETFVIEGTTFTVEKMKAMQAWSLLDRIRSQVGDSLGDLNLGDGSLDPEGDGAVEAGIDYVIKAIAGLPPEFVDSVRRELFDKVAFVNERTGENGPRRLLDMEHLAIEDPISIYEIILRCLAVNFWSSSTGRAAQLIQSLTATLPQSLST